MQNGLVATSSGFSGALPECKAGQLSFQTPAHWQHTVDLLIAVLDVALARITRLEPGHLSVLVSATSCSPSAPVDTQIGMDSSFSTADLVAKAATDPAWPPPNESAHSPTACLGLPLRWPSGALFGAIEVFNSRENPFSPLADHLLEHTQHAIETDLLAFHQAEVAATGAQRQAMQFAITTALLEAPTPEAFFPQLLQIICASLGWEIGEVWLEDTVVGLLSCKAAYVLPAANLEAFAAESGRYTFEPGADLPGRVWQTSRPAWIGVIATDTNLPRAALAARAGLQSAFAFPIHNGNRVSGVINVFGRIVSAPDEGLLVYLYEIGNQIGRFLEHRHAVERILQQGMYLSVLHETTLDLIYRLDVADLLETIIGNAAELAGTPHGFVALVTEDNTALELRVGTGVFHTYIGTRLLGSESLTGKAWQTGRQGVVENYPTWSGRSPHYTPDALQAAIEVPLLSKTQVIGVIGLAHLEAGRSFSSEQISILHQFGQLAALALDNARFYHAAQQELSERKRAEAALQESEARFRLIFESSALGICSTSSEGSLIQANRALQNMLGYSADELREFGFADYTHPDDLPQTIDLFTRMLAARQDHFQYENRFVRKDGGLLWVLVEVAVVRNAQGELHNVISMVIDISDRKKSEQAQRELALSKDRFLSQVSHELRNPLAGVVGFGELLSDRLLKLERSLADENDIASIIGRLGKLREFADRLKHQGKQMTTQINDLLDMRRLETGKLSLTRVPCDLAALAQAVIEQQQLTTKRHHLSYSGPPQVLLKADEIRLEQVLTNLISNAVRYAPGGGPIEVSISRQPSLPSGESPASNPDPAPDAGIFCSIRDQGLGIPEAALSHIFDYTYQVERPEQEQRGGLGLGLFLCKEIVELHAGKISVRSQVGQGSTFTIWLPLHLAI